MPLIVRDFFGRHPLLKFWVLDSYFRMRRYIADPRIAVQELLHRDFSQFGETRFLREELRARRGYVVEVGANDGRNGSAAYGLILDGWSALLIEPADATFARLKKYTGRFKKVTRVRCAVSTEERNLMLYHGKNDPTGNLATISEDDDEWYRQHRSENYEIVPGRRLTNVLREHGVPAMFELLIVDAEGMDLEVLESLDFSLYRPRVIMTEVFGPKQVRKHALLTREGYLLIKTIGCNEIWRKQK